MIEPEAKRWVVITVPDDGSPQIDAEGFDSWALYTLLTAAANAAWMDLPDAVVTRVSGR